MRLQTAATCLMVATLALSGYAQAEETPPLKGSREYFSDVPLLDQTGKRVRFYSDLLQGKVVVINSFFGTCTSICPPMMTKLRQLQNALGDRLGREVFFVSLTVDPERDTPTRLREFARNYGARPGWSMVTGKKENVDWALYKVGHFVDSPDNHSGLLIIGNEATRTWKKIPSTVRLEQLLDEVESVVRAQ